MQYITTTELRTESPKLIETLKIGQSVALIHRSKVVGKVHPAFEPKPFDTNILFDLAARLPLT